jgi:hypothetical protein
VALTDPRDVDLPNVRFMELVDNETGEFVTVDTSSRAFRRMYRERAMRSSEARDAVFRRMKADAVELHTGESFVEPLTKFFRARRARL